MTTIPTAPTPDDPKALALWMVANMQGVDESQRAELQKLVESVPAEHAAQAVQLIVATQTKLTRINNDAHAAGEKIWNKALEDEAAAKDAAELAKLEAEIEQL